MFDAYGWPHDLTDEEILERLVALNAARADEERRGTVRWLRPEFQNPGGAATQTAMLTGIAAASGTEGAAGADEAAGAPLRTWPKELPQQIAAVRDLLTGNGRAQTSWSVETTARAFKGSRRKEVESVLDSLAALGLVIAFDTPEGKRWRAVT